MVGQEMKKVILIVIIRKINLMKNVKLRKFLKQI